jgi:hypothetical protein
MDLKSLFKILITFTLTAGLAYTAEPFNEANGLVVMEVESAPVASGWTKATAITGFRGAAYYLATINSTGSGGKGLLEYPFKITTAGKYQLQWRSRIAEGNSSSDCNDSWARVVDANGNAVTPVANDLVPSSTWYKVYMNSLNQWYWQASNHDNQPRALAWQLQAGKTYTFQVSVRSKGHALDRIVLYDTEKYNYGDELTGRQSSASGVLTVLPESSRGDVGISLSPLPVTGTLQCGPNPFTNTLNTQLPEGMEKGATITIYDQTGTALLASDIMPGVRSYLWKGINRAGQQVRPGYSYLELHTGGQRHLGQVLKK